MTCEACRLHPNWCLHQGGLVTLHAVLPYPSLAPQVRPVTSGTRTLKDATSEAIRDWVTNVETTHYILGSVAGPHPFPMMVRFTVLLMDGTMDGEVCVVGGRSALRPGLGGGAPPLPHDGAPRCLIARACVSAGRLSPA